MHLILFIVVVIQSNGKYGKVTTVVYGLNWLHKALRLQNPCESAIVKTMVEGAKRILKRPTLKKEPMSPINLRRLANTLRKDANLLRTLTMAIPAYAGFFRYDEVSRIRRSDILFEKFFMKIFIEKSKCDQYRAGAWVNIARTNRRHTCPYKVLTKYLETADIDSGGDEFIFRGCVKTKAGHKLRETCPSAIR